MNAERLLLGIKRAGRRAGVEILRYNPANVLDAQRALLVARSRVDLAVDGGANRGQWARGLRAGGYAGRIVSVEPLAGPFAALAAAAARDPAWEARRFALTDRTGEAVMHRAGNEVSSSLLRMSELHERVAPGSAVVDAERVPAVRLDELDLPAAERVYLKLDLQGAELRALVGAEALMGRVALVEVELSYASLYEDAPLADRVANELGLRGFGLAAIATTIVDPASGRLLQADAIFAREAA